MLCDSHDGFGLCFFALSTAFLRPRHFLVFGFQVDLLASPGNESGLVINHERAHAVFSLVVVKVQK